MAARQCRRAGDRWSARLCLASCGPPGFTGRPQSEQNHELPGFQTLCAVVEFSLGAPHPPNMLPQSRLCRLPPRTHGVLAIVSKC